MEYSLFISIYPFCVLGITPGQCVCFMNVMHGMQVLGMVAENCLVGLITFGTYVHVHELGFAQISKIHVFKGTKEVTKDQLLEQMGFFAKRPRPSTGVIAGVRDGLSQESISRFLLPASDCEFVLNSVWFLSLKFL